MSCSLLLSVPYLVFHTPLLLPPCKPVMLTLLLLLLLLILVPPRSRMSAQPCPEAEIRACTMITPAGMLSGRRCSTSSEDAFVLLLASLLADDTPESER